ncbi:MAG: TIGR04552 family protein [Bdellovibrionota bacterium]
MKVQDVVNDKFIENWDFNWPVMEVLIGGKSPIDLPRLHVQDEKEAHEFLLNYGYDGNNLCDQKVLHAYLIEAIHFIECHLMPKEWSCGILPPNELLECQDVRKLLLWASHSEAKQPKLQDWACAILRVMHTIAHLHGMHKSADVEIARTQIMKRFEKYLFRDRSGGLWLGDDKAAIELERVEWKNNKDRNSVIMKLLHKPGNVAETIYDLLGVRFITKRKSDVMMVVKFLRDFYMVTFPNINPARSRNTILGLDEFKSHIDKQRQHLVHKTISAEEFLDAIENGFKFQSTGKKRTSNPHSASSYRSIQLTCRQLIRYKNPSFSWKEKIKDYLEAHPDRNNSKEFKLLNSFIDFSTRWNKCRNEHEVAVFFPFEVQILDQESNYFIEGGEASHDRYKKSQMRAARKRILRQILWGK